MIECNICFKRGDKVWVKWHKENIGHSDFTILREDEEPPSKRNKDSFELCVPRGGDLDGIIFGCQPLLAGNNNFRSLVWACHNR